MTQVDQPPRPRLPFAVRWHGRGGQGAMTASRLLATAALRSGLYPQSLPDFGAERSGAPVAAYTRIGQEPPALRGPVAEPDAIAVLDAGLLTAGNVLVGATPQTVIVLNTPMGLAQVSELLSGAISRDRCSTVDSSGISLRLLGRQMPNVVVLGALIRVAPIVGISEMIDTAREELGRTFSDRVVEANIAAIREGFEGVVTLEAVR